MNKIGRLRLSSRDNFKIGSKSAKKCHILSSKDEDLLIITNKEFTTSDTYIDIDTTTNTIKRTLGNIGNKEDDINIYYHLYTIDWMQSKKYRELGLKLNLDYDCEKGRSIYSDQVITIDPKFSTDLDDGFTITEDSRNYIIDIHIADPTSYFDFKNPITSEFINELKKRLCTCYIPFENKINHLLPENFMKYVTLISDGSDKRAITFRTILNKYDNTYSVEIFSTILQNIKNYTYEDYDTQVLQVDNNIKEKYITICNILLKIMNCKIDFNIDDLCHKFIEVFMIWVNYISGNKYSDFIVRTQEKPETEIDFSSIPDILKNLLNFSANYQFKDRDLQKNYHYSLNLYNYSHVSSPMRRFIDMYNHLIIHNYTTDELKSLLDRDIINIICDKLKYQKRIANAFELLKLIKINNDFKACVLEIKDQNTNLVLLGLFNEEFDKKKIILTKLPIKLDCDNKVKLFDILDIKLNYNSTLFKNHIFPFSITLL
jgi:exoribonuclease R